MDDFRVAVECRGTTLMAQPRTTFGVIAGRILAIRPHPAADRIRIAEVEIGGEMAKVEIVFGGPDLITSGLFVPVAPPGARLPDRKKMRRRRYRGVRSWGMLCSTTELGWQPDGPDEVAMLEHEQLEPGFPLDEIDWREFLVEPHGWRLEKRAEWNARLLAQ